MNRFTAMVLSAWLSACAAPATNTRPTLSADDRTNAERDIAALLDDWHDAAARADEPRFFGHLHPDAVYLGTDATERWDTDAFRMYAHPIFARGRAWVFHPARRAITLGEDGQTAWFDENLETAGLGPARGTGVVVRGTDGRWRIVQYSLSVTIPNERFEAVRQAISDGSGPTRAP